MAKKDKKVKPKKKKEKKRGRDEDFTDPFALGSVAELLDGLV